MLIPTKLKLVAAAGLVAASLAAASLSGAFAAPIGGPAAAATPAVSQTARPAFRVGVAVARARGFVNAVANFLGMTPTDLTSALKSGQTLTQVAQAHGKSQSDLVTFLQNQLKAALDKAVANGKITSQQEQTVLNKASTRINTAVTKPISANNARRGQAARGAILRQGISAVAQYLGMTPADLTSALKSGQTLAQAAQAHGKSQSDLESFLTNQLKSRLDKAVANGKITSQQEQTLLSKASSRIDKLVNTNFQQALANRKAKAAQSSR